MFFIEANLFRQPACHKIIRRIVGDFDTIIYLCNNIHLVKSHE